MDLHALKRANIITNVLFNLINHIISLIVLYLILLKLSILSLPLLATNSAIYFSNMYFFLFS
jgi:hypothetical protein